MKLVAYPTTHMINIDNSVIHLSHCPSLRIAFSQIAPPFPPHPPTRQLMQAIQRANLNRRPHPFHWVASDGWGKQLSTFEGLEDVAAGAITVELQSVFIDEFDAYMAALRPATNVRNPWFAEFWEQTFRCRLPLATNDGAAFIGPLRDPRPLCPDGSTSPVDRRQPDEPASSGRRRSSGFVQDSKVQFVIDAVYAFAHGLHQLQADVCDRPSDGLCPTMAAYDGKDFYRQYLLNVSFVGECLTFCWCCRVE